MRCWTLAALLLAACQEQSKPEGRPAEIAFDGAMAANAAALRTHGERISRVLGCHGCHGDDLQGQEWDNDPKGYGLLWASNLTRAVPAMSDAQLETLLREGVHPERKQLWVMPSQILQHMSDADMKALIAYLRSVEPAGEVHPTPVPGPKAIAQWKSGEVMPAADEVRKPAYQMPPDLRTEAGQGRYIISMTCTECHGGQLTGVKSEDGTTPDLVVAGGYSKEEFERFLTTGVPSGNRKLKNPLMSQVAKSRFSHMTVAERDSVYAYLKARAEQPQ
jgi:cytochrome c553